MNPATRKELPLLVFGSGWIMSSPITELSPLIRQTGVARIKIREKYLFTVQK
jgi:hypothetical protein